jgi:hypothetical protein
MYLKVKLLCAIEFRTAWDKLGPFEMRIVRALFACCSREWRKVGSGNSDSIFASALLNAGKIFTAIQPPSQDSLERVSTMVTGVTDSLIPSDDAAKGCVIATKSSQQLSYGFERPIRHNKATLTQLKCAAMI